MIGIRVKLRQTLIGRQSRNIIVHTFRSSSQEQLFSLASPLLPNDTIEAALHGREGTSAISFIIRRTFYLPINRSEHNEEKQKEKKSNGSAMATSNDGIPNHNTNDRDIDQYVLAVMNYARLKKPLNHDSMKEFSLALEPINVIAKNTPGFVWSFDIGYHDIDNKQRNEVPRLQSDPLLMPQLSCWNNIDSLRHFVYKSGHAIYYKRKREWFTSPPAPYVVCWWHKSSNDTFNTSNSHNKNNNNNNNNDKNNSNVKHIIFQPPTLKEAFDRCDYLNEHGPTSYAFDMANAKHYTTPMSPGTDP